jgi:hypothetical protein
VANHGADIFDARAYDPLLEELTPDRLMRQAQRSVQRTSKEVGVRLALLGD